MHPHLRPAALRVLRSLALGTAALALPLLPCTAAAQVGSPWQRAIEAAHRPRFGYAALAGTFAPEERTCEVRNTHPLALVSGGIPPLYPAQVELLVPGPDGEKAISRIAFPVDADSLRVRIVGARCRGSRPVRLILATDSDTLLYTLQHRDRAEYEHLRLRDPQRGWQVPVWNAARLALAAAPAPGTARPASSASPARRSSPESRGYYRGPRGGCYTYTSGGNKRYVDRSYCN